MYRVKAERLSDICESYQNWKILLVLPKLLFCLTPANVTAADESIPLPIVVYFLTQRVTYFVRTPFSSLYRSSLQTLRKLLYASSANYLYSCSTAVISHGCRAVVLVENAGLSVLTNEERGHSSNLRGLKIIEASTATKGNRTS